MKRAVCFLIMLVLGAVFSIPFLWTLSNSLKSNDEIFTASLQLLPSRLMWENYPLALQEVPLALYFANSIFITTVTTVLFVASSAVVAYGFARLEFPLRGFWFAILLATMMLPFPVTMVPTFLIFSKIGWYDTWLPLIVPACFGNAFFIFLLRQFFRGIPRDLEEAAVIDGCSTLGILVRIFLPLSRAALATAAVFAAMTAWNDFLGPLLYLNSERLFTLPLGLAGFQKSHGTKWNLLMAASVITIAPVIALFFAAQRHFIEGITLTGIKN